MLKTIQAEFIKSSRNGLFTICAAISFAFPLFLGVKDMLLNQNTSVGLEFQDWTTMAQDITITVILMVLSGIIITLFCQREYTERTIIGQLTSPISRTEFIFGKLIVWGAWHMILVILSFISTIISAALLYPQSLSVSAVFQNGISFLSHGFLVFLTLLPLLAISFLQKVLFYPSLLLCLLFTLTATCSNTMPGLMPFVLPWSAARLIGTIQLDRIYLMISMISILACAVIGLVLSLFWFKRQKI